MGPAPCRGPARWPRSPSEPLCAPSSTAPPWKCFPQGLGLSTGGSCRAPTRAPPPKTLGCRRRGLRDRGGGCSPPAPLPAPARPGQGGLVATFPGSCFLALRGKKMKFSFKFSRNRGSIPTRCVQASALHGRGARPAAPNYEARTQLREQPGTWGSSLEKKNKKHARKHVRNAPRGPGWSRTSRVPSG